jgi:hypothetical protein
LTVIPLGKGAFERIGAPEMRLVNMLYEQNPTNQEDQTSLLQRPGLVQFATCGSGPVRGIFRQEGTLGGLVFVVSGTNLYKVTADAAVTQIGANGAVPGTGRVSMAGSASSVLIASDAGLYKTDASTVSAVSLPTGGGAVSVAYIAGIYLAVPTGSQRIYFTQVGGTSFEALNYFSAEFAPDDLRSVNVLADFVHFIGKDTTEIWVPTGNLDLPFQRLKGRLFNVGTADKSTVVRLDNTLFWVGNDRSAYRLAGQPQRISDHGIDQRLRSATDLRAWACVLEGHGLWIICTGAETLVFDVTTQQWTEFASYGQAEFRCHLGVQLDSTVIGADRSDGRLWTFARLVSQDGDGPLVREWTGAIDQAGALARCDNVVLDCTTGSAALDADPMVELRVSDDLAKTWSDWLPASLGRSGQYGQRVAWTRLGLLRDRRAFHFRTSANCNVAVRKGRLNERL